MLTYLFEAHLKDGTIIKQTQDDISTTGTGSAFTDVRLRMNEVTVFGIYADTQDTWAVDLRDGTFYHNNHAFTLPCPEVTETNNRRLIYYRQHQHVIEQGQEHSHTVQFVIGWQATVEGKNHQRTIAVW
jgi:hypothetical protein